MLLRPMPGRSPLTWHLWPRGFGCRAGRSALLGTVVARDCLHDKHALRGHLADTGMRPSANSQMLISPAIPLAGVPEQYAVVVVGGLPHWLARTAAGWKLLGVEAWTGQGDTVFGTRRVSPVGSALPRPKADAVSRPDSEEIRRSGGDRLWERLDLGHPGSHILVESACQLKRADVVRRMDEDGRGTPLTQPVSNCVEPVLPSRDCTCRVVPAYVADDGIGS